ncbi:MAG: DUF6951 family protein [Saccharofermentanales bacterium]
MAKSEINAGICGFITEVETESEDLQTVIVKIKTQCPNLKPLEKEPMEVDGFVECFGKIGEGEIFEQCRKYCRHAACPVPTGIIKAVEIACEIALPKDVEIKLSK